MRGGLNLSLVYKFSGISTLTLDFLRIKMLVSVRYSGHWLQLVTFVNFGCDCACATIAADNFLPLILYWVVFCNE